MHLGNGAITPSCAIASFTIAGAGLAFATFAARRTFKQLDEHTAGARLLTAAALGALVFGAQMINVPVMAWSSGHLVGGVLLAWVLGPAVGVLVMATVLAAQAFVLGDGGTMALGANIINMALIPAGLVALVQPKLQTRSNLVQCSAIAGLSLITTVAAAAVIVGQVAIGRGDLSNISTFASQMLAIHIVIGLLEAGLTVAIVAAIHAARRDRIALAWRPALATAIVGLALMLAAGALSSDLPDGYEASAQNTGMSHLLAE